MPRLIAAIPALLALVAASAPALAHAILIESTPPINGTAPAGDLSVTLRYNSRIDAARSRLTVIGPDHMPAVLPIAADPDAEDVLHTRIRLAPGSYVIRWQVLAIDGHITRGDVPFTVTP